MRITKLIVGLLFVLLAYCLPASAQLSGEEPDPLARIRDAAKTNVAACSATGETLCEQVAPKIIANAQGESPLSENVRRLIEINADRVSGTPREAIADAGAIAKVIEWAVSAFRAAGVDVHTETYAMSAAGAETGSRQQETVVAEIRGREKPDEWVLLGAHLDAVHGNSEYGNGAISDDCDAALVIEAARDIQLTGIRPRRSIRFVLFTGQEREMLGSWAYVRAHRQDLDRARAAILIAAGANRANGYTLNGRRDLESGVREALKPIDSMGVNNFRYSSARLEPDSIDFVLEGIPTIVVDAHTPTGEDLPGPAVIHFSPDDLKRNAAIAGVTAFDIAERVEPLGPRQSRSQIESVLKDTGLETGHEERESVATVGVGQARTFALSEMRIVDGTAKSGFRVIMCRW